MKTKGGYLVSASVTILSLILIVAGFLLLQRAHKAEALSVQPDSMTAVSLSLQASSPTSIPTHLTIPNVQIDINVKLGTFDNTKGQWTVNERDAFYAAGTSTPIIYAHNQNGMFANLKDATYKDRLIVTDSEGMTSSYIYDKVRFVAPDDPSVLVEKNNSTIILLTCEGLFSESRRLTYFRKFTT